MVSSEPVCLSTDWLMSTVPALTLALLLVLISLIDELTIVVDVDA